MYESLTVSLAEAAIACIVCLATSSRARFKSMS